MKGAPVPRSRGKPAPPCGQATWARLCSAHLFRLVLPASSPPPLPPCLCPGSCGLPGGWALPAGLPSPLPPPDWAPPPLLPGCWPSKRRMNWAGWEETGALSQGRKADPLPQIKQLRGPKTAPGPALLPLQRPDQGSSPGAAAPPAGPGTQDACLCLQPTAASRLRRSRHRRGPSPTNVTLTEIYPRRKGRDGEVSRSWAPTKANLRGNLGKPVTGWVR